MVNFLIGFSTAMTFVCLFEATYAPLWFFIPSLILLGGYNLVR